MDKVEKVAEELAARTPEAFTSRNCFERLAHAAIAAYEAALAEEGYVVVPAKATEAMVRAGNEYLESLGLDAEAELDDAYIGMLAAAPTATLAEEEEAE